MSRLIHLLPACPHATSDIGWVPSLATPNVLRDPLLPHFYFYIPSFFFWFHGLMTLNVEKIIPHFFGGWGLGFFGHLQHCSEVAPNVFGYHVVASNPGLPHTESVLDPLRNFSAQPTPLWEARSLKRKPWKSGSIQRVGVGGLVPSLFPACLVAVSPCPLHVYTSRIPKPWGHQIGLAPFITSDAVWCDFYRKIQN